MALLISGCGRVVEPPRVSNVTMFIGSETDPAISPDGKKICFAWWSFKGVVNLYSKPLEGEGGLLQLTADPEIEASPRWSPDGRWIAYLRYADYEDTTTSVRVMASWGGDEREIAVIRQANSLQGTLDWTRDGAALIVATAAEGLVRISVRDGARTSLGISGDQPAVSPDGWAVVYRRDGGIFRSSLRGRIDEKQLAVAGSYPVWSTDGKEVIYSHEDKLWRVENATAGLLGEVMVNEARVSSVRAAPPVRDAPFVYTRWSESTAVYKMDVASQERRRVIHGAAPDISADGKSIVFTNGGDELWMCDIEGRDARPIHTRQGQVVLQPFFSADGTSVMFVVGGEDYAFDLARGTVKKVNSIEGRRLFPKEKLPQSPFLTTDHVSATADGRTVVYAEYESRGWDIRKIDNYR